MIEIVIDEGGFSISDEATNANVFVSPSFSGSAILPSGMIVDFDDVRDFIDAALLVKKGLEDRYGRYK